MKGGLKDELMLTLMDVAYAVETNGMLASNSCFCLCHFFESCLHFQEVVYFHILIFDIP